MTPARAGALAAAVAAALLAGCGKPETPKVNAATERAQATERARQDAFGTQVKALENAKSVGADMNRKAQDTVDDAEKNAK